MERDATVDKPPKSVTHFGLNTVALVIVLVTMYLLRTYPKLARDPVGTLCAAVAVPVVLLDVMVLKVHRRATTGLDWDKAFTPSLERVILKLAGLLMTLAEVHGLGLQAAQGLVLTEGFYWDQNDKTRAFSERFMKRTGRMPNMIQAGTYSATLQYLKAVKAAGTKDSDAVVKKLKELPVDDVFAQGGKVLENGRMVHDLYLFEVKKPSESKKPWDYYKQLAVVPGDKAFPSAKDSGCPLTK